MDASRYHTHAHAHTHARFPISVVIATLRRRKKKKILACPLPEALIPVFPPARMILTCAKKREFRISTLEGNPHFQLTEKFSFQRLLSLASNRERR